MRLCLWQYNMLLNQQDVLLRRFSINLRINGRIGLQVSDRCGRHCLSRWRFANFSCPVRTHIQSFDFNDLGCADLRPEASFASYSAPRVHQKKPSRRVNTSAFIRTDPCKIRSGSDSWPTIFEQQLYLLIRHVAAHHPDSERKQPWEHPGAAQ